jgi:hypothetical protein
MCHCDGKHGGYAFGAGEPSLGTVESRVMQHGWVRSVGVWVGSDR